MKPDVWVNKCWIVAVFGGNQLRVLSRSTNKHLQVAKLREVVRHRIEQPQFSFFEKS